MKNDMFAKTREISSASETLEIINKQWLTRKDIETLAGCKKSKATKIMHEINESAKYKPVKGLVPTDLAVDYLKINISYLKRIRDSV